MVQSRTVVLTRARGSNDRLAAALTEKGWNVLEWPAVEIQELPLPDDASRLLEQVDGVVFPSPASVTAARSLLGDLKSLLAEHRVWAQGPGTSERLGAQGLAGIRTPTRPDAQGLAQLISEDLTAGSVVIFEGDLARTTLSQKLEEVGIGVRRITIYRNQAPGGLARARRSLHAVVYA
ncbi:MAG: uroporphyrinogen-III synthase, partial [Myxococcota bacterium]|nr:uroporphyrinogen-III synthase [Myxococcota bacterium]